MVASPCWTVCAVKQIPWNCLRPFRASGRFTPFGCTMTWAWSLLKTWKQRRTTDGSQTLQVWAANASLGLSIRWPHGLAGYGHRGPQTLDQVPVEEFLGIDREYRQSAAAGKLAKIAPRRFNPKHEAWLPILHTQRGGRNYSALFSNTARAHKLGKTGDWVILYYDGGGGERQCTVITSQYGGLKGKRIVRGREADCARYYHAQVPRLKGVL
jgi:hypothetical protein